MNPKEKDKKKFPNSRLHPRVIVNAKISSIKISEKMRDAVALVKDEFVGQAVDISVDGIGIFLEYYLPTGVHLDLDVEGKVFGVDRALKMKAEVRYCNFIAQKKYRCGMKFIEISKEDKEVISEFVKNAERRRAPRVKLYPDE